MNATYISANSFSVPSDKTLEFVTGRRVKCDCGVDGIMYTDVVSATYSAVTTVVIDENSLTSNLVTVLYGVVEPGPNGSLPNHDHSITEGMGGEVSLLHLSDTPTTYSGTEDMYLRSTGSGTEWATISGGVDTFLDLNDTPSTYSGTTGAMLVSNGSSTEFTQEGVWLGGSGVPTGAVGNVGNYYLAETPEEVYKKNRPVIVYLTARSVILDMADNYGQEWYMSIRRVEFKLDGTLLDVNGTIGATAYDTTNYDGRFLAMHAFDVSLPKTGSWSDQAWLSGYERDTNQRLICVFDSLQNFDEIVITNGHSSGTNTDTGVTNIKIHMSTDAITSTVYNQAITNSTLLFDGVLDEHVASDVVDDQIIDIDDALAAVSDDTGWDRVMLSASSAGLLDLTDTPTTYSGAEGKYLRATASGTEWADVSANLVDLNDTPSTYDDGKILMSTSSGTEWGTPEITTVTGTILYGTGNPPDPVDFVDGTLFFKYVN